MMGPDNVSLMQKQFTAPSGLLMQVELIHAKNVKLFTTLQMTTAVPFTMAGMQQILDVNVWMNLRLV